MKKILLFLPALIAGLAIQAIAQHLPPNASIAKQEQPRTLKPVQPHRDTSGYNLHHMQMELTIDPDTQYIAGNVTFRFQALRDNLQKVHFDLKANMQVEKITTGPRQLDFTHSGDVVEVQLESALNKNEQGQLTITYKGTPTAEGFGTFEQAYQNQKPIIWTLSEPFGARDWFPCKQWLRDKVDSLDIFITHPKAYKAASNGVLVSETTTDGQTTTHWKHRYPIATYLIAIAVTDYVRYSDYAPMPNGDSLEIVNYIYRDEADRIRPKTKNIIPIIELFNELFGPYPFAKEKYGHAQFGWGGGMEHQTISFMANFGHELMAHELAHQWFGDYITCGSWKEIWLNEGFAVYLTGLTYEHMFDGNYWRRWRENVVDHVTSKPGGSVIVDDTTNIRRIFDYRLSYNKAGYVLHMLRKQIGDEAFFRAMRNYLNDPSLQNHYAHTKDAKRHFEAAADTSLNEFFSDWIYGEGYPLYSVKWSQNEQGELRIEVSQNPSEPEAGFFEMHITLEASGEATNKLLRFHHTEKQQVFTAKPGFNVKTMTFNPELSIITRGTTVSKIDEFSGSSKFRIIPNPAQNRIRVEIHPEIHPRDMGIYSSSGKLIRQAPVNKNMFYINIASLQNGSYVIKLNTREGEMEQVLLKI